MEVNSVTEDIEYIDSHARSKVECGSMWEEAVMSRLARDPEVGQHMGGVSLRAEAPTDDGHDTGK